MLFGRKAKNKSNENAAQDVSEFSRIASAFRGTRFKPFEATLQDGALDMWRRLGFTLLRESADKTAALKAANVQASFHYWLAELLTLRPISDDPSLDAMPAGDDRVRAFQAARSNAGRAAYERALTPLENDLAKDHRHLTQTPTSLNVLHRADATGALTVVFAGYSHPSDHLDATRVCLFGDSQVLSDEAQEADDVLGDLAPLRKSVRTGNLTERNTLRRTHSLIADRLRSASGAYGNSYCNIVHARAGRPYPADRFPPADALTGVAFETYSLNMIYN